MLTLVMSSSCTVKGMAPYFQSIDFRGLRFKGVDGTYYADIDAGIMKDWLIRVDILDCENNAIDFPVYQLAWILNPIPTLTLTLTN